MFRDTAKTKMSDTLFGIGSVISAGNDSPQFLVISSSVGRGLGAVTEGPGSVTLLNLATFCITGPSDVRVEDINLLSQSEVRTLLSSEKFAVSDYDFDPKGLKGCRVV